MAYPSSFSMEEFKSISSFAGKAKYCAERLTRLSSGSGRIVYQIDNEKVLKLAKNSKGVAQNEMESDQYVQQEYDIVAKTFDWDSDDNFWVEMELAKKVTPNDFKRIVGVPLNGNNSIEAWLTNILGTRNSWYKITPEIENYLNNNSDFAYNLHDFAANYGMVIFDFFRLSSWGKVNRDGKETIVLIDFGLSENVYKNFYKKKQWLK
jgi:hypothetical protein